MKEFKEVINTEEFYLLPVEQVCEIISNDVLNVASEELVYKGVIDWIRHDELKRKIYLSKVFFKF